MLIAAALYAKRSMTLAAQGPAGAALAPDLLRRRALLVIVVALVSPIADVAEELVIAHMVEHLLLGDIATLLLVLGLTGPLLQPILAIRFFDRLRILAHPLVAFPLWALNFYLWHVPALYDAAYGTAPVHALEHATFIFFGCLMWMPVFGPLPKPQWFTAGWKVVYVIAVRFAGGDPRQRPDVVGHGALHDLRARASAEWHLSPITDQSIAGVIMMVEGTFLGLGAARLVLLPGGAGGDREAAAARPRPGPRRRARRRSGPSAPSRPARARAWRRRSSAPTGGRGGGGWRRRCRALDRARAWLVTGPLGRGARLRDRLRRRPAHGPRRRRG